MNPWYRYVLGAKTSLDSFTKSHNSRKFKYVFNSDASVQSFVDPRCQLCGHEGVSTTFKEALIYTDVHTKDISEFLPQNIFHMIPGTQWHMQSVMQCKNINPLGKCLAIDFAVVING